MYKICQLHVRWSAGDRHSTGRDLCVGAVAPGVRMHTIG